MISFLYFVSFYHISVCSVEFVNDQLTFIFISFTYIICLLQFCFEYAFSHFKNSICDHLNEFNILSHFSILCIQHNGNSDLISFFIQCNCLLYFYVNLKIDCYWTFLSVSQLIMISFIAKPTFSPIYIFVVTFILFF